MTAGVIGTRCRASALIVCAIGLVTGTLAFAATSTLSTPATPAAAPGAPRSRSRSSSRTSASRPTSSRRARSSRAASPGGSRAPCPGFAANVVVSQSPAPGARVIADGAPIIVLRLSRNGSYEQEGVPENVSPYAGKPARLVGAAQPKRKTAQADAAARAEAGEGGAEGQGRRRRRSPPPPRARTPAFKVAGAPAEPLDEIVAQRPREAARRLGREAPAPHARERRPLALPAQLDRHRRGLRLGGRRRGAANADRGRRPRPEALGDRRPERAASPATRSPRSRSARS